MSDAHDDDQTDDAIEDERDDERDDALDEETTPRSTPTPKLMALGAFLCAVVVGFGLGRVTGGEAKTPKNPHAGHMHELEPELWTCSMHPQVDSFDPTSKCPICGMDLIPASEVGGKGTGPGEVALSPRAKALARIRTEAVTTSTLESGARELFGRVVEDEGAARAVTSWVAGRVDTLNVSTTGERVRKGQKLASMYSPEVYTAHQDLLVALKQVDAVAGADAFAQKAARGQVASARQRLRLLGFSGSELERMERAKTPWTTIPIRSTASGTVLRRKVRQGEYVQKGQVLFELSNLKTVWVELDAYESNLAGLTVDQEVRLEIDALAERTRRGSVTFIDPRVDPRTRVATVRVEVSNSDGMVKPGMFVRAAIGAKETEPGKPLSLVIPRSAPLFAGERALVYVETKTGEDGAVYQAREVVLGARVGEHYVVRAGLERGERVVTHGAFALDSDLQLRGTLSLMGRPDDTTRASEPMIELDAADQAALAPVIAGYLDVGEQLAEDDIDAAKVRAKTWRAEVSGAALASNDARHGWKDLARRFDSDLERFEEAGDLEAGRRVFSNLTELTDVFLGRFGNVLDAPIRKAFCPMVRGDEGDHWYQRGDEVDNVYFGSQMRRCGEIQRVVRSGERVLVERAAGGGADGR